MIRNMFHTLALISFFQLEHKFSECVTDLQLQGAKFITNDGRAFGVTGYDSNEIIFYKNWTEESSDLSIESCVQVVLLVHRYLSDLKVKALILLLKSAQLRGIGPEE